MPKDRKQPDRRAFEAAAEHYAALSDATRLEILWEICQHRGDREATTPSDLVGWTGHSMSTVSRHLRQLGREGFITADRRGSHVFLEIDYQGICEELHSLLHPARLILHGRRVGSLSDNPPQLGAPE